MARKQTITYKKAGVDIAGANRFLRQIKQIVNSTQRQGHLGEIGSFGGFFELSKKFKNPVLVASCDGVGTKLKIAFLAGIHSSVGIDLVAMNVNDCVCSGAQPLFFLDYIATGRLQPEKLIALAAGIAAGCREAGCALIGGETAEMPGFYRTGEYDLSGFCVAAVEKNMIIDGSKIKLGDQVIGLASSGLHSNGFSLVRKLFSEKELKKRGREFLKPTRIYAKAVLSLIRKTNSKQRTAIRGIAHITGGAFIDKLPRILAQGLAIQIKQGSWPIPEIFSEIKNLSCLGKREMFRTFNMGIGMALIVRPNSSLGVIRFLQQRCNLQAWVIGRVVKGKSETKIG